MDSLKNFLTFHIEKLTADQEIPIDLRKIAAQLGAVISDREMIPEAAMEAKDGRFHIYLQSNFHDMAATALRSRFSLAHEIGHILFFERRDGEFKLRSDAPKGEKLEFACHQAAALLLVPNKPLQTELRKCDTLAATSIEALATLFQVSIEVILRRLHDIGAFENDWTPILTRRNGNSYDIEYAPYPPWLKAHFPLPKKGADFASWFRPTEIIDSVLRRIELHSVLEAQPFHVSATKTIFDLRLLPV